MNLDYTLTYDYERLDYIKSLNLKLFSATQISYITNYILYGKQPSPTKEDHYLELEQTTIDSTPTRYIAPKPTIPWNHPELQPLHQAREILSQLIDCTTNNQTLAFLKRWRRELSQDATPILNAYLPQIQISPNYNPELPPDIDLYIDYTNSFHIKHILLHYSKLRQSNSNFEMDYFDYLISRCNFPDWQLYMLIRRIDGANANIIGFELAEKYHKFISTTYMSTIMRSIYKKIAQAAIQHKLEHIHQNDPTQWRICPRCHRNLLNNKYNFNQKKKNCKQCERKQTQTAPERRD